nr:MAG TPA: hypothetical protein [Caudoviricetes sp.]
MCINTHLLLHYSFVNVHTYFFTVSFCVERR